MSEQHPLLYDELSEEDRLSPRFQRRLLMSRARARNHVKGAAAIITRWPDHWTALLSYWWIGVGMIAITTYVIYNCLFAYATLQPPHKFHHKPSIFKTVKVNPKPLLPPKVFMHIFVDTTQEIDLDNYMPYIELITNKHKHCKYELIIVANDTNVEMKNLSDKENNEYALNLLWKGEFNYKHILTSNSNLNIQYVSLSTYLQDSPIKKHWKTLPHKFVKFLLRAFSVWEKGGIAFDPILLTPQSPHSVYIDKINNILWKYNTKQDKAKPPHKKLKQYISNKTINEGKSKPNNIRDIINAFENEGVTENYHEEPLVEAETKDNFTKTIERKLRSAANVDFNKEDLTTPTRLIETQNVPGNNDKNTSNKDITNQNRHDSSPTLNLLPLFLKYLLYSNETSTISNSKQADNKPKGKVESYENKSLQMKDFWRDIMNRNNYKPMIIKAKGIFNQSNDNVTKLTDVAEREVENSFEVTIDLEGNIIATDTSCHAFIGSMFVDAIHHDQSESLTDFIIKELSIFCKGLLASCVGIDVILL